MRSGCTTRPSARSARYLATGRRAPVFGLVYDAENPYFGGVGAWPGWPAVLEHTLRGQDDEIRFRAVSWQGAVAAGADRGRATGVGAREAPAAIGANISVPAIQTLARQGQDHPMIGMEAQPGQFGPVAGEASHAQPIRIARGYITEYLYEY
jgi:hypothetical protein